MAKKRFSTAWGWKQARSIRRLKRLGNAGQFAGGVVTGASLGATLLGVSAPLGGAGMLGGLLAERIGNDYVAQARGRAMQVRAIEDLSRRGRLAIARGAAARSSHVMRAARSLNRSAARSSAGSDGRVQGYYRQGPSGQVFVREYTRQQR